MIEISKALYGFHKEPLVTGGTYIGQMSTSVASASCYRPSTVTGAAKISAAASVFDAVKVHNAVSVYQSNVDANTLYVEINGVSALVGSDSIRFTPNVEDLKPIYRIIPHVIWSILNDNGEMAALFTLIMRQPSPEEDKDIIAKFCDSYYYNLKANGKLTLDEMAFSVEEVQTSFQNGLFEPCKVIKNQPKSIYETMAPKTDSKKKAAKESNFMNDVREGKYIIPYAWTEALQSFVVSPKFLNTFETTPEFEEIVKKIFFRAKIIIERMDMGLTGADAIGKDALNIMLLGKPGTGKTTLAYALSAATGMPVSTTAWNKHSDEDEVEGKTKIVDGKPAFVETNALLFHEFGGIDVNEEINLADPSVTMGSLGQKLEYPFIVKKNGYETIVRHPLNVVIATMNVGTNGSNPLNQALANRFKTPYILDDPTSETFINILMKSSGKSRKVCEWVYKAYDATKEYLKSPDVNEDDICQNLSIRTCLGAIENMEEGQTPQRALINSIVGAVAVVDIEVARNLQREKIELLPNPKFEL